MDLDLGNLDPQRRGATAIHSCCVCDRPLGQAGLHQMWIYLRVATDVLPLLVNTYSSVCVAEPPDSARDYIPAPHKADSTSRHPTGCCHVVEGVSA